MAAGGSPGFRDQHKLNQTPEVTVTVYGAQISSIQCLLCMCKCFTLNIQVYMWYADPYIHTHSQAVTTNAAYLKMYVSIGVEIHNMYAQHVHTPVYMYLGSLSWPE